ncbi:hypothetical protein CPC08DRAFT_706140 [Agrocybe pediades]|nr:hypothetical protein CPC08DRAFT_706140 [Agrocybe pediades]
MPTATTTTKVAKLSSFPSQLPLKASIQPSTPSSPSSPSLSGTIPQTSKAATLRSLYTRAARAFVIKDIPLTYSLLRSAFDLLDAPQKPLDSLSDLRRKWDILRITFESTVYISPPPSTEILPESLRTLLSDSPQSLATSIYNRSLALFTPSVGNAQKAVLNAAYLPVQVLTTLIYCSLKLDASDVGRIMVEDWLAHREPHYSLDDQSSNVETEGYVKVLDLYCLHILPRLEQWEYAKEFLEYESEMPSHRRQHLKTSLNNLYVQAMASRRPFKPVEPAFPTPSSTISSPRSNSPAPSSSSSSSSLSTTSTHTVVPSASKGTRPALSGLTEIPKASSSSSSVSSDETATPRAPPATLPNGNTQTSSTTLTRSSRPQSLTRRLSSSAGSGYNPLPRSNLANQVSARPATPSTYALIRASLAPYLTSTRVTTFLVLFVVVPLISFVLRMRRRKRLLQLGLEGGATAASIAAAVSANSNADLVRRRLQAASGGMEGSLVQRAWGEIVRVVGDTVRMAGSGLV